jgi:membrane protein YqaA with SNARE-associated domain
MSWTLAVLGLLAGLASALLPFVNAEALAAGTSRFNRDLMPLMVVALAAGQTIGKLLLFEAARRSTAHLAGRPHRPAHGLRRIARTTSRHVTGVREASARLPVVALSALTGLPPLAVVAVAAGTTRTNRTRFAAACFVGRTFRFALIAYGLRIVFVR